MALLFALFALACDRSPADGPRDDRAAELKKTKQQLESELAPLIAAHGATPAPGKVEERVCDEASQHDESGKPGAMVVGEAVALARLKRADDDPWSGAGARYKPLTAAPLRILVPPARVQNAQHAIDALWNAKKLGREYSHLGVLVAAKREAPRLEGEQFHGGEFDGALVVFRLGKAPKVVCAARLSAQSSERVAGLQGKDRDDAMWNDFLSNLKTQVHAAAKRVAPALRVDQD